MLSSEHVLSWALEFETEERVAESNRLRSNA